MHRKKVFGWILVQTIFSSPRIHFLLFSTKFHIGDNNQYGAACLHNIIIDDHNYNALKTMYWRYSAV